MLTTRIVNQKFDSAGDVNLSFLLRNFDLFRGDGFRAGTTAVFDNVFDTAEESGMAMKVNLAVFVLVPLSVEDCRFR